jgi:hypothetical protein
MADGPPTIPSQRTPANGRDVPRDEGAVPSTVVGLLPGLGAAAAVAAITIRVLSAAAFDPDTALALVGSAGQLTVLIGGIVTTLPYLALGTVLVVISVVRRRDARDDALAARLRRRVALALGGLAAALLVVIAPWYFVVVALVVGSVLWMLSAGAGRATVAPPAPPGSPPAPPGSPPAPPGSPSAPPGSPSAEPSSPPEDGAEPAAARGVLRPNRIPVAQVISRARRLSRPMVVLLLVVVAGLFLVRSDVWAPAERLQFSDGSSRVAFVMSVDETWTTLLTYPDRSVLRVRSDLVTERAICQRGPSVNAAPTLVELVTRRLARDLAVTQPPRYPRC